MTPTAKLITPEALPAVPVEVKPPAGAEQRFVLYGVSWETYKQLSTAFEPHPSVLLTYDKGALEIMSVSLRHEKLKKLLGNVVEVIADEMEIDCVSSAQTTLRLETEERGLEGDDSFYFTYLEELRHQDEIDLAADPAPDLAIEVDISSPSVSKFPIYANMGVREIWRYHREAVRFYRLTGGEYVETETSAFLPGVTPPELTELIAESQSLTSFVWRRKVRDYARQCKTR